MDNFFGGFEVDEARGDRAILCAQFFNNLFGVRFGGVLASEDFGDGRHGECAVEGEAGGGGGEGAGYEAEEGLEDALHRRWEGGSDMRSAPWLPGARGKHSRSHRKGRQG